MNKIDAILYTDDVTTIPEELQQGQPEAIKGDARLHYIRVSQAQLDALANHYTVLAKTTYKGIGTTDRVYQQILDDPEKLALYESVYDTAPREMDDGEGGTTTYTPPFKFGMLAESTLPVPESVTSRQGMEQLIRSGLDEQVDAAIAGIADSIERKLARNWIDKAGEWERDNPQLLTIARALELTPEQTDDYFRAATLL